MDGLKSEGVVENQSLLDEGNIFIQIGGGEPGKRMPTCNLRVEDTKDVVFKSTTFYKCLGGADVAIQVNPYHGDEVQIISGLSCAEVWVRLSANAGKFTFWLEQQTRAIDAQAMTVQIQNYNSKKKFKKTGFYQSPYGSPLMTYDIVLT
jgi:hypothetical protein